jgi:5-dehydro-2-deoxygluconokinase
MLQSVYMLAIDHRWQWEEWCDGAGVARTRIPEIKLLAAEAFLEAHGASAAVRESGALLVDLTYGRDAFDRARAAGVRMATPAERAGAFPLEWTAPFEQALPGEFVKVLVRHRSDVSTDVVVSQRGKLLELQRWCAAAGKTLVLEVLVAPAAGEEEGFDADGRPRLLAEYIRDSYAEGLVPPYWKIEGMPTREALAMVDTAIREKDGPRQLILGKGAGMDAVRQWFAAAAGAPTAAGFAIGRTVYFEPCSEWIAGRLDREAAVDRVASNYTAVIDAWRDALASAGTAPQPSGRR